MSDVNKLILAEGDEARKINEKKTSNRKVVFLKGGKSFRGRFITTKFVTYAQHGDFEKKIQSHACLDPKGRKDCPSCKAGVARTTKTIIAMYNIETGEIVVRDMAKGNMENVYKALDTYGDDLTTDTFDFSLGEKGALSVMYVKPKKGEEFAPTPADVVIDDDLLSYVMGVRTPDEILDLIAGKVEAKNDSDVKIERGVGDGHAPGPKNDDGSEVF